MKRFDMKNIESYHFSLDNIERKTEYPHYKDDTLKDEEKTSNEILKQEPEKEEENNNDEYLDSILNHKVTGQDCFGLMIDGVKINYLDFKKDIEEGKYKYIEYNYSNLIQQVTDREFSDLIGIDEYDFESFQKILSQDFRDMLSSTHIMNFEQRSAFLNKIEDIKTRNLLSYCIDREMYIAINSKYAKPALIAKKIDVNDIQKLFSVPYDFVEQEAEKMLIAKGFRIYKTFKEYEHDVGLRM